MADNRYRYTALFRISSVGHPGVMPTTLLPAPSRRHGRAFWAVAFALLMVMAYSAVPTPLYVIYQQRDGFSAFMITVIYAAYAVGVVVSLFLAGHVSDWHGRRRVFVPGLLLSIVSAGVFLVWSDVPGLLIGRVIDGLSIGAVTATATTWLAELHAAHRPDADTRRAQSVATAANLGGIGFGPLVAGALAEWVGHPLIIPYVVFVVGMVVALGGVLLSPETRDRPFPKPRYRAQRISVPRAARREYLAAALGALIAFAALGLFNSLAPSFLAGTLGHPSRALAGAVAFLVFAAAAVAQLLAANRSARNQVATGIAGMLAGMGLLVVGVWLPTPSLALFLVGGGVVGAGAGLLFKGALGTVVAIAADEHRAEALAGLFLAGYVGLSVPVIGLGVLTQSLHAKVSLLIFAGLLAVGALAAAPMLLERPGKRSGTAALVADAA
jgi:MFS family permease